MTFSLGSRAASSGYRLAAFDSIGSTNAEALMRARTGETGPIWLVTKAQTAGRGRRQRAWLAPPGNLAASIVVKRFGAATTNPQELQAALDTLDDSLLQSLGNGSPMPI